MVYSLAVFCVFSLITVLYGDRISDKRLCADPECSIPISHATALLTYGSDHPKLLPFRAGEKVVIYSKSAGTRPDLWGAEIKGKRGYVPKGLLRETKIFQTQLKHTVPTENYSSVSPPDKSNISDEVQILFNSEDKKPLNSHLSHEEKDDSDTEHHIKQKSAAFLTEESGSLPDSKPSPETITASFDVVDGTTVYLEPNYSGSLHTEEKLTEIKPTNTVKDYLQYSSSIPYQRKLNTVDTIEGSDETLDLDTNDSIELEQKQNADFSYEDNHENSFENESEEIEDTEDKETEDKETEDKETEDKETEDQETEDQEIEDKEAEDDVLVKEKNEMEVGKQLVGKETQESDTQVNVENKHVLEVSLSDNNEEDSKQIYKDKLDSHSKISDISNEGSEIKGDEKQGHLAASNTEDAESDNTLFSSYEGPVKNNESYVETRVHLEAPAEETSDQYSAEMFQENIDLENIQSIKVYSEDVSEHEQLKETEIPYASTYDSKLQPQTDIYISESALAESKETSDDMSNAPENDTSSLDDDNKYNPTESPSDIENNLEIGTDASVSSDPTSSEEVNEDPLAQEPKVSEALNLAEKGNHEANESKSFFSDSLDSIISGLKKMSQLDLSSLSNVKHENDNSIANDQESKYEQENEDKLWPTMWGSKAPSEEPSEHIATDPDQTGHKVEILSSNDLDVSSVSPICKVGIDCSGQIGEVPNEPQQLEGTATPQQSENVKMENESSFEIYHINNNSQYMIIAAAVTTCVIAATMIASHIVQKPRYVSLTATILKLEKDLQIQKTENASLKEELHKKEKELNFIHTSSTDNDKAVMLLKSELELSQVARSELEEQVASLEKELEAATEAGLELNRMLSDFLSTQHGSETLVKSVEHLQKQLDSQQHTISEMNTNLTAKTQENENLQQELKTVTEKLSFYEEELTKTTDALVNIQKEKLDLMSQMENKIRALQLQLTEMTESTHVQITNLTSELEEARETVAMRDSELTVLQDCLRQLKALEEGQGSERLDALLDVGHARAELALITMERDSLKERLCDEEDARRLLEDHTKIINKEVENLRLKFEEAEREKVEAQTKLEVLTNYFKEKETQLQRELGLQEAMYMQKEGDASTTYERIKSLQEEVESYKSQNEMLKKEIIDQERSLKGQLATLEKKAHENWVAARQAERKLEESRQEAGHLRNRLTVVEKNITNTTQSNGEPNKAGDRLSAADSNGELPTSFLHLGMPEMQDSSLHYHQHRDRDGHPASPPLIPGQPLPPFVGMGIPPPGIFMPPPPLPGAPFGPPPPPPLFPGDRRPPPLGRMSSPPPPPHRYSPEPRGGFSPYDRTPPLSPPSYDDEDSPPDSFRHRSPPPHLPFPPPSRQPPPPLWDDPHSSFRTLPSAHRDSPRESKGSALSSGHSSESLDKSSRHSGRV